MIALLEDEARTQLPEELRPGSRKDVDDVPATVRLVRYLRCWCERCPRPVVLFLDEVDALVDETLLSVRLDLCVRWPLPTGEVQRWAVELKVWRDSAPAGKGILSPAEKGLVQLSEYLTRLGLERDYLVVFDARSDAAPLPERVSREELEYEGRTIDFWRL